MHDKNVSQKVEKVKEKIKNVMELLQNLPKITTLSSGGCGSLANPALMHKYGITLN